MTKFRIWTMLWMNFRKHIPWHIRLVLVITVLAINEVGICGVDLDAQELHLGYRMGNWFAFGALHSEGTQLLDILHGCDSSMVTRDRIAIIDSVQCTCLQSKYFLVVLGEDEVVKSTPILRWIVRGQDGFHRQMFENSVELEEYIRNDYSSESVRDSMGARQCSIALASLLSPFLPVFFPERRGQLKSIFGAIWGQSLWNEALTNSEMAETIGSAAISGDKLESISRFAEYYPYSNSEDDFVDSLAGATFSIEQVGISYLSTFVTWSPRRSTFFKWRFEFSPTAIKTLLWDDIVLPKAGVLCAPW